jgi:hypothetical protein
MMVITNEAAQLETMAGENQLFFLHAKFCQNVKFKIQNSKMK